MRSPALAIAALLAGLLALPQIAEAASAGRATGSVNMRACASVKCGKMTVIPYGATVWIFGSTGGWYHLTYNGLTGYASGRYIVSAVGPVARRAPPPSFGYCRTPSWDPFYGAWYDGCRWYHQGAWYGHPSGFFFGFRFGG
ncbi:MAG: SH3 domain-containing protein [Bauldia sp.]